MLNKLILTILGLFFACCTLMAQNNKLEYSQKLSISEGLAHNGVTSIFKDSNGYLWISTYDGLNRYDGYECTVYKNTLDKTYFVSNRIRTIAEDKFGNLWLGTDEGITLYNYSQEIFSTAYSNKTEGKGTSGPIVRKIFMNDQHKAIVCATEGDGILVFNEDHSIKEHYLPPANLTTKDVLFFDGIELDNDNYLFSTSIGLFHFKLSSGEFFRPFPNDEFNGKGITYLTANTVLTTGTNGVNIYTFEKTSDNKYSYKLLFRAFPQRQFTCATVDKLRNLWLGTAHQGVIRIADAEAFVRNEKVEQSDFTSSSGFLRTSCFLPTENYGCWVGTFNHGLYQFNLKESPYKHFNTEMDHPYGLRTNEIMNVVPTNDNKVYLASNSGGIVLFNLETEKYEPLPFDLPQMFRLNSNIFFIDSKENIWIRSHAQLGIFRQGAGTRKIETISCESYPDVANKIPRAIVEDRNGNIWLGCNDDVYKLTLNEKQEIVKVESLNNHPVLKNNKLTLVRTLYVDPLYDYIWVGNDNDGLVRVEIEAGKPLEEHKVNQYLNDTENEHSISSNFVSSIIRLPNNELWIGTERGGVNKVVNSNAEPQFIAYSEKNGLSNNVVKNILCDNENNLWIPTNIGLNKFDTKEFRFRTFGKQDGLPFEDFLYPALTLPNGNLLFSGSGGFFYFNTSDIKNNEVLPKLRFGKITLYNKTVLPGEEVNKHVLFAKRLKDKDELVFKHNENVFSIELTSLHYSTPDNHFLKYKLEPLNETWHEVPSGQRFLDYNGLQPGSYELKVMASNSLNEWTKPISLKILIKPPFWLTPPAFILYILFIVLIIYAVMFYLFRINKLQLDLEIEQFEKDKVKEVNAAKLRFFSNISHEIKTPLTLISGPVNLLSERFKSNDDVREKLQIVQRQSKKMLRLVNQVHDFQRADANQLKLDYSVFCFDDFINELVDDFTFKANNDKKKLLLNGAGKKLFVKADNDKLEKIMNNLLNNAFKFTTEGDTISIDYKSIANELVVKVSDTGRGIHTDDLPHVFERFYQSKKKHSEYTGGSGIGLAFVKRLVEMHYGFVSVESLLNKGTTFILKLPVLTHEPKNYIARHEEEILEVEKNFDKRELTTESIDPADIKVDEDYSDAQIFFVEDNTDMRAFISGILSNFFKVKSFANGKQCREALDQEWPDIVISDVLMPEMNGFDLCKNIKSDIKTSHIPVILLTACTTIEDNLKGLEVGADSYIKKPFNVQHLITRTESLLKSRKRLRERFQVDLPLKLEKRDGSANDIAFLEKLYALMEENLDNQNLDLDRFAKELYLNRTHFYQKVKALSNQTPFELLKSYRLKKAAELLVEKNLSVNEVFVLTGFKSRTHFSKLFKETYNVTPGKYAAGVLNKNAE